MGIEGMQSSLRNNKRDRKSIFDDKKVISKASRSEFEDNTKMTEYEFHEFQKKIKLDNKIRHQKFLIKSIAAAVIVVLVFIYILFFA